MNGPHWMTFLLKLSTQVRLLTVKHNLQFVLLEKSDYPI